jgi:orotidine-5'-phosphate decarboxylase
VNTAPPARRPITTEEVRQHLALALDVADAETAVGLVRRFRDVFGVAKVGLELFVASGPDVVREIAAMGVDVLLDLKLHDIPTTVARAATQAAATGARYVTVHTSGGSAMLRAAVEGYRAGSPFAPADSAGILGVTVLTSDLVVSDELLAERAGLAREAGCAGVVCAAHDLGVVCAALGPERESFVTLVPAIRLPESGRDDQSRVSSPGAAWNAGADLLVIGRTVTAASDPEAAAARVVAELLGDSPA